MKMLIGCALAISAAACSATTTTDVGPLAASRSSVQVNGPLRLVVKDTLARPGVLYALPSIAPQAGSILVTNTRYGSLCRVAVSGAADVHDNTIGVHVAFSERSASCTSEIRALSYEATVSGLSHGVSYDVAVIHDQNGSADTVRKETVVVR